MTLNRVPSNSFEFTEQASFAPEMIVPGVPRWRSVLFDNTYLNRSRRCDLDS